MMMKEKRTTSTQDTQAKKNEIAISLRRLSDEIKELTRLLGGD